ncbi:MAG: SixA phosphatase family protein [Mycobacterium sp.]
MRHAKSDYPTGVADHERPLAPRGVREAGLAGDWIRASTPPVEKVLCSSATRTRQTLARTQIDAPTQFVDRLYGATPGDVIDEINHVADEVTTLLVLGHEPAVALTALGLSQDGGGDADATEQITAKFPTAAIAVLRTEGTWHDLTLGGAELSAFHIPR